MALPKLFVLLDALDLKQVNAFKKYTLSKVSESSEIHVLLLFVIQTKAKRNQYPDAESLIATFMPDTKIKLISNNLSILYAYAEEWMALQVLEESAQYKDLLVQKFLNNNGLYNLADQTVNKMRRFTESIDTLDLSLVQSKYEMLYEHLFSTNMANYNPKPEEFMELSEAFDEYVSSQYLVILTELYNRQEVTNISYKKHIQALSKKIKDMPDTPLTNILSLSFKLIAEHDFEALLELKNILISNQLLKGSKLHYIITHYVIKRANNFWVSGHHKDSKLIIELTNYGIETGVFFKNGKLSSTKFLNLVMQLCVALNFKEVSSFITQWIGKVNTANPEATMGLAMALNCFYKHKYSELAKYTWRSDFDGFNEKNIAHGLFLVGAFKDRNKNPEIYENAFHSSTYFLKRNKNKMSKHLFDSYNNLLQFMKDFDKIGKSKINLDVYNPLLYRSWCEYELSDNIK
jgi:hypothetical protein